MCPICRVSAIRNLGIGLHVDPDQLVLEVEDDGTGMLDPLPADAGLGLRLMNAREQFVAGRVTIAASPAGGTLLRCSSPLSP